MICFLTLHEFGYCPKWGVLDSATDNEGSVAFLAVSKEESIMLNKQ